MDIKNIMLNFSQIFEEIKLKKEFQKIMNKEESKSKNCQHIIIYTGSDYPGYLPCNHQYNECLLCGKKNIKQQNNLHLFASTYKLKEYGHGEVNISRDNRMREIRKIYFDECSDDNNMSQKKRLKLLEKKLHERDKNWR